MGKLKLIRQKPFFFPLSFILLHCVSHGVFYFWVSPQIWSSGTYWINWTTVWVIYYLAYKKHNFILALSYILTIVAEFFFVNMETVVGGLEGVSLVKIDYNFILTKLYFVNFESRTVIHYSLFLAGAHLIVCLLQIRKDGK